MTGSFRIESHDDEDRANGNAMNKKRKKKKTKPRDRASCDDVGKSTIEIGDTTLR